jgi:hypothetical protein
MRISRKIEIEDFSSGDPSMREAELITCQRCERDAMRMHVNDDTGVCRKCSHPKEFN